MSYIELLKRQIKCVHILERYREYVKTKDLIQENTVSKENLFKTLNKMETKSVKRSKPQEEPKKTRVRSRVRTKKGMEI